MSNTQILFSTLLLGFVRLSSCGDDHSLLNVRFLAGFHYYRRQLDEMENPEEAHARRGAHWTFNATAFVQAIRILKETGAIPWTLSSAVPESSGLLSSGVDAGQAKMPSFDHAVGDPVEEDVNILQEHKIVFIEGNYVLLGTHHVCRANVPFQSVIVTFTLAQMHLLCRHRALE